MKKKENIILIFIILLGLFFRLYKIESFYIFEHDQDLFAWIAKDIVVDHHFRLIGQLTSIDGLFIGPLYYYLLAGFMALFKMDPIGALIPATLIGLATVFSFYFVISRFWSKTAGLLAAFIYAASAGAAFYDHWIVPTQPVILWSVWFLYVVISLSFGKFTILPVLAILLGLIWHIHIALTPLILLIPAAFWLGQQEYHTKRKLSRNATFLSLMIFLILTAPFFIFELRHQFQQIHGLITSLGENRGEVSGLPRLVNILGSITRLFRGMFFTGNGGITLLQTILVLFSLLLLTIYLKTHRVLSGKISLLLALWTALVVASQTISKRPVSEYYFLSLLVPLVLIVSLVLTHLYRSRKLPLLLFLGAYLIFNLNILLKNPEYQSGYLQKKAAISYIADHIRTHGYQCAGINYMTTFGQAVGFRYFIWQDQAPLIQPTSGIPVYSVVLPWTISPKETLTRFGTIGIIVPKDGPVTNQAACTNPKLALPPLLGFTN